MTDTERRKAFQMRLDGKTYEQIADELHYSPQAISKDLHSVLEKSKKRGIIYPALAEYVRIHYGDSIDAFARALGVSSSRLRRVIVYGEQPRKNLKSKILNETNLTEEEAFTL